MFSKKAEYALRAIIYIARASNNNKKLGVEDIARSIDAPQSFTAKILQLLTRDNKIISSSRGPNGGFYITDSARKLSMLEVLEVIEENETITKCVLGLNECSEIEPCPLHHQYSPIKRQLLHLFEMKTIQGLADELDKEAVIRHPKTSLRKFNKQVKQKK
jgi:Rrf2 family transcriptional regulator, iron-sulfur cluster assembly transcription factor